jgi:hypothetical protein
MKHASALIHITTCLALGALAASFTSLKWITAALLTSAALQINGALASYEDALPGGFDNPDGEDTAGFTSGSAAAVYWAKALGIAGSVAALGLWFQFR